MKLNFLLLAILLSGTTLAAFGACSTESRSYGGAEGGVGGVPPGGSEGGSPGGGEGGGNPGMAGDGGMAGEVGMAGDGGNGGTNGDGGAIGGEGGGEPGGSAGHGGSPDGGASGESSIGGSDGGSAAGAGGEAGSAPACDEGDEQCIANVAHRCNSAGVWVSLNACAGDIVDCPGCTLGGDCQDETDCGGGGCVGGECTECAPDDTECTGSVPRFCSSSGTWVNQAPCSGDTPVCEPDTGECLCEEDASECLDEDSERRCVDGQWEEETCPLGCVASAERCRTDTIATPGIVACDIDDDVTCDTSADEVCCLVPIDSAYCTTPANCLRECRTLADCSIQSVMAPFNARIECDWHDDCSAGDVCCVASTGPTLIASCKASCPTSNSPPAGRRCDPDAAAPCPGGEPYCDANAGQVQDIKVEHGLAFCHN